MWSRSCCFGGPFYVRSLFVDRFSDVAQQIAPDFLAMAAFAVLALMLASYVGVDAVEHSDRHRWALAIVTGLSALAALSRYASGALVIGGLILLVAARRDESSPRD